MNRNFQNNFRGGWNNMPPSDFGWGQIPYGSGPRAFAHNWHIPHQMPAYYAHNPHIPHQMPTYYAHNRHIPHQAPTHFADNKCLPHPTPEDCANKKCLPPILRCETCDLIMLNPEDLKNHKKTKRHRRRLFELREQSMKQKTSSGEEIRHNQSSQISKEAYAANKCLSHQTLDHCAAKRQLSQQSSEACADKRQLPDQTSEQYADKNLSQQTPKDCADKRQLFDHTSVQYADKNLSQQTPKDCADKRHLSDQTSEQYADKNLSQQTPKDCADKKCLPQQTPKDCADKKCLPQQTPENGADKKCLPQQTPKDCTDKKCSPQQTHEDCADKKCLPPLLQCEICDLKLNPKCMEIHNKGMTHRRELLELQEQSTKHKTSSGEEIRHNQSSHISKEAYAANKCLSHQTPDHYAEKRQLPQQTSEACADKKQLSQQTSEACADKRQLSQQTSEACADKRQLSQQTSEACADKMLLPDLTSEQYADKNLSQQTRKNCVDKKRLPQQTPEDCANKKCLPPLLQKCEICDLKLDPEHMEIHIKGRKHRGRMLELRQQSRKHKKTLRELGIRPNRRSQTSNKGLQQLIRCEICNVQFGPKCLKDHNNGLKHKLRLLEQREKSMKHKGSNGKEISHIRSSQVNPVVQPKNVPAEMSKRKVRDNTDANDHGFKHEIEGATGGKYMKMNNGIKESVQNDQPQSTPVELKASAGANIIAEKEYLSCDFAATVIPQGPVASHVFTPPPAVESSFEPKNHTELPREVTVAKEHQCGVETNDEPQLISMDAVGSSFEPVTEHGLDTETEPHMSEAILYTESQHPTEETDIELLPPVLMEIDVALEVSAEPKTEDGNSQEEMKMDVDLSPESGKTKLRKVSVCLMCGDKGFEKSIVYCSKCGDYAMHRYCLARPVAFTDKVTWFCMDCEVVEAERPNSETPESERPNSKSPESEKDNVVHPQPIADPIWRGSLQVFNKSFDKIRGLMGHLSTLASPKVLEEASHLPDVLYANLLQRSAVWPESFKKFGTNNLSIGLYFFPENERVERYYDQLVDEMISKDLAIRVMVEKTELIIFPSTLLPRQYKRFHSKYYLWGIFRRKQVSSTIKDK